VTLLAPPLPESVYAPLRARLEKEAESLARRYEIQVEPVFVHGIPHEVLTELARGTAARLIVVAALGTKHYPHWLVGSVAERVVQTSPVPVLVVREAESVEAWAEGERALRVTVGVDLGPTSKAALRWIEQLRWVLPCDVRVLQIAWPLEEHGRLDVSGLTPLGTLASEVQALLERDLRVWAGSIQGEGEVTFVVRGGWGRVDTDLTSAAAEAHSDLLVVGTHQHARTARVWQGSVSRGAIHYASSNVVSVPVSALPPEKAKIRQFRSVLIPTDFSALADQAIPAGYGLLPAGGVVHLLHVAPAENRAEFPGLTAQLQATVPEDAAARGIVTQVHVIEGDEPSLGIWHAAGRLGVDAVCMATHGGSGLSRTLLGSQALAVVRRVRQPVVLVKSTP
ncbi:MAG TPA: universal stress protein, partial [Polyangiaceae bacterium]|nr:universal stress protein [Polyangiaceae bacterium]